MPPSSAPAAPNTHPAADRRLLVRKLEVQLEKGFALNWHGDAFRSQFFNALSMSFPVGEQFFIDCVRDGLKTLANQPDKTSLHAQLQPLVQGFVGQEATHRHLHGLYNTQLDKQGFNNQWQHRALRRIEILRKRTSNPLHGLAVTAAYEHYTALLADGTLRRTQWMDGADEQMQLLWRWHAAEETEHRAVAFDVYQALGGNYAWRVFWFMHISLVFAIDAWMQTHLNLKHVGARWRPSTWWIAARFFWCRHGMVWSTLPGVLAYFRRSFHPDQEHQQPTAATLANHWLAAHSHRFRVVSGAR